MMKRMKKEREKEDNDRETMAREQDKERAEKLSRIENEAVIEASKPKAKKARLSEEAKKEKKKAKEKAMKDKKEKREKDKKDKADARKAAKDNKAAKVAKEKEKKKKGTKEKWTDRDDDSGEESDEDSDMESVDMEDEANADCPLPWKEWVVMDHATNEADGTTPFFRVAMYGHPPKEMEKEEWCERKHLVADGAKTLVDKCIREHANYPPYSEPLLSKKKKKEEVPVPAEVIGKSCPCEHKNYRGAFKPEDHPGFCEPGHYLHNLKCGGPGCDRTFAANKKEEARLGKDKASRPTAGKPVCCCVNIKTGADGIRSHQCGYALCNPCWTRAMLDDDGGDGKAMAGGRRRAARAVTGAMAEV